MRIVTTPAAAAPGPEEASPCCCCPFRSCGAAGPQTVSARQPPGRSSGAFRSAWYAQSFFDELVLIYPTYAILMAEHGVGPFELSVLFAIWAGSAMVFEVPSGVLGDLFSRPKVVASGSLIKGLAFGVWWLWPTPLGFALGFVVWSLGEALRSGTSEALLHDTLADLGEEQDFEKVLGRGQAAAGIGVVLALGLGGVLAESGYTAPLLFSMVAPMVAGTILLLAVPEPRHHETDEEEGFWDTLRAGSREVRSSRTIATLVGMSALLATTPDVLEEYDGLLLLGAGMSLATIGYATAGIWLARTAGVAMAHRLKFTSIRTIALLYALANLLLLPITTSSQVGFVLALVGYNLGSGVGTILVQGALQRSIDGSARATVTSLAGVAGLLCGLGWFLFIGLVAATLYWPATFLLVGAVTLVLALGFAIRG